MSITLSTDTTICITLHPLAPSLCNPVLPLLNSIVLSSHYSIQILTSLTLASSLLSLCPSYAHSRPSLLLNGIPSVMHSLPLMLTNLPLGLLQALLMHRVRIRIVGWRVSYSHPLLTTPSSRQISPLTHSMVPTDLHSLNTTLTISWAM